jgi:hypothetical protein
MTQATHLLAFGRLTDTQRKVSFEVKIVNDSEETPNPKLQAPMKLQSGKMPNDALS